MKLREFLNYRTHCLTCNSELNTSFHSRKQQKHKTINNRLLIQMDLKTLKKGQKHYKVGYSIDYDTNDFCIEFFDREGTQWFNETPLFLLKRFKSLDKNHGKYFIIKYCGICNKYWYSSNSFDLDYKNANLGSLSIQDEHGVFFNHHNDGYRIYILHTFYDKKESTIYSLRTTKKHYEDMCAKNAVPTFGNNLITTHMIPFKKSSDIIIERLNKLITFS
jgi:hypothetical protein